MNRIKNTDNPNMLVYYLYKNVYKDLKKIKKEGKEISLTDLYRLLRPSFQEAPSKPYTNKAINKFNNTVRRGKASGLNQVGSFLYLIESNFNIYGGYNRAPELEEKEILTDAELMEIDNKVSL